MKPIFAALILFIFFSCDSKTVINDDDGLAAFSKDSMAFILALPILIIGLIVIYFSIERKLKSKITPNSK